MLPGDDPSLLTPDQRLSYVAGILAVGILRLQQREALPLDAADRLTPENLPESANPSLEVSGQTVLSVHNG